MRLVRIKDKEFKVVDLPVNSIIIPDDQRAISKKHVKSLAVDIKAGRLRTPISVYKRDDDSLVLISGGHRLAAVKRLKRKTIPAFVIDESEAEEWAITENLLHLADNYLAECIAFSRLAKIRAQQSSKRGGAQPHDLGIKKISRELGVSDRTVSRRLKIAKLDQSVQDLLRQHKLTGRRTFLANLSVLPTRAHQLQAIVEYARGKSSSKSAVSNENSANLMPKKAKTVSRKIESDEKPKTSWRENFDKLGKQWRFSSLKELYEQQDFKTKVAFVRKVFDAKVISKANKLNVG